MQRNSAHLTDYFRLPVEAVVEIGRRLWSSRVDTDKMFDGERQEVTAGG